MDKDRPIVPYIIVELKKPKLTEGKEQLKSYHVCLSLGIDRRDAIARELRTHNDWKQLSEIQAKQCKSE